MSPLLQVRELVKQFPLRGEKGAVHAVNGVSFDLEKGETLGLFGESGSGKSTIARCVARLLEPTGGAIFLDGKDITTARGKTLRNLRRRFQIVFQDPGRSLNPRMRVGELIEEPLLLQTSLARPERKDMVLSLLEQVRLDPRIVTAFPTHLSGGQQQRVAIARAIATKPDLIVLDEPISSLDMSVRWEILNLLRTLQEQFKLAYLFTSHDLRTVKLFCHRVAVLYLGKFVETGTAAQIFNSPRHPYTQALLAAIPIPDPVQKLPPSQLHGEIPSPVTLPTGCFFHDRCPFVMPKCSVKFPDMITLELGRQAACYKVEDSGKQE